MRVLIRKYNIFTKIDIPVIRFAQNMLLIYYRTYVRANYNSNEYIHEISHYIERYCSTLHDIVGKRTLFDHAISFLNVFHN